jgi:lipopolysaccharide transport system ATP-binding protein
MNDTVISVEGVGKRYFLSHRGGGEPTSFREYVSTELRALGARLAGRKPPPREEFWALSDVSFDVQTGDVLGIVGRNGAGKSTLLKILSRITAPTKGRVRMRGRVASLLEVGTGFHPELTGRENIYLNGAILGMGREEIRRKFDEMVAFAEIDRFLDTPVKRYSSGMYVRLAFAVAAHLEPEILIVDEVLAVGDAAFQKKCLGKMGEISSGGGRTVLFVSHNMAAVSQLCTRAVWLDKGQVRFVGSPAGAVHAYLDTQSADAGTRGWTWPGDAPGDDRVRLLRASVIQGEKVAPVVDINEPCEIELEFVALLPLKNLHAQIRCHDATELVLFHAADWRPSRLAPGRYLKRMKIPPHVFQEGQTRVMAELNFYDPRVDSVAVRDAITFEAVESDHPNSVRGPYKGPWPGALRLRFDWSEFTSVPDKTSEFLESER